MHCLFYSIAVLGGLVVSAAGRAVTNAGELDHETVFLKVNELSNAIQTTVVFENEYRPQDVLTKFSEDSKCFDNLGCYDKSIGGVFPSSPTKIAPWFSFNNNKKYQVNLTWTENSDVGLLRAQLAHLLDKSERPFVIITHGFGESIQKKSSWALNDAVLHAYPDAVTMLVDWSKGAAKPLYNQASANVPLTAHMTANFVFQIMEAFPSVKPKNIYFIGFSLGGQFAGYFARQFITEKKGRIGRIAALDAASPLFESKNIMPRKGEADFVEAVHTSAGNMIVTGKFGVFQAYADVDFYPNGGVDQPKCSMLSIACSHTRARLYYINALLNQDSCQMKGIRCKSVEEAVALKCSGQEDPLAIGQRNVTSFLNNTGNRIISFKTSGVAPFCPIKM